MGYWCESVHKPVRSFNSCLQQKVSGRLLPFQAISIFQVGANLNRSRDLRTHKCSKKWIHSFDAFDAGEIPQVLREDFPDAILFHSFHYHCVPEMHP